MAWVQVSCFAGVFLQVKSDNGFVTGGYFESKDEARAVGVAENIALITSLRPIYRVLIAEVTSEIPMDSRLKNGHLIVDLREYLRSLLHRESLIVISLVVVSPVLSPVGPHNLID